MNALTQLPNIGKELEKQLQQAGIDTYEDLQSVGAEEAWLRIQQFDPSACINRLLALEGAIQGVKKTLLPEECKSKLKEFYHTHKK